MRPQTCNDFTKAIICALVLEADAVEAHFDEIYDGSGKPYGKVPGDANAYVNGRIGKHNVVLCYMPRMGKGSAASVARALRISYPRVELALVVGICGGAPYTSDGSKTPIYLGDVLISDAVIEYDFGGRYPDGFRRKTDIKSTLAGPSLETKALLNKLMSSRIHNELEKGVSECLGEMQGRDSKWQHPGSMDPEIVDILFEPSYVHRHRTSNTSLHCCCSDSNGVVSLCDDALESDCNSLGCLSESITRRRSSMTGSKPSVHIDTIASADTVLKSGQYRDEVIRSEKVIGFEMEGAGAWEIISCLVIKGVCDYADSHKSKIWQKYAAAAAASAAKAFLEYCEVQDQDMIKTRYLMIPFPRNLGFVGRQSELHQLEEWISLPDGPKKLAITGLGGVGKTQIAIEFAYRMRDRNLECSIFWIPCTSAEAVDQAFMDIAERIGLHARPDTVKSQLQAYFSLASQSWLMIFDNADDIDMWTENSNEIPALGNLLPYSDRGHILFTTRTTKVAARLASAPKYMIHVSKLGVDDGLELLRQSGLPDESLDDTDTCIKLLEQLEFLPLAITQATCFIHENPTSLRDYLTLLNQEETRVIELLSEDFDDEHRYKDVQSPVAMTWFISFKQIQRIDQLAITYLSLMACLDPQNIPRSFLPEGESKLAETKALGILCAYSLIKAQQENGFISMHRLVFLATRSWLRSEQSYSLYVLKAADRFRDIFPSNEIGNRQLWRAYIPHVLRLFEDGELRIRRQKEQYIDFVRRLAFCLWQDERLPEAREYLVEVLNFEKKEYGTSDGRTLDSMCYLTKLYMSQGQYSEAESLNVQTLMLWKTSPTGLARTGLESMVNMAQLCMIQAKYDRAEELLLKISELESKLYDKDGLQFLTSQENLAFAYERQGRFSEATDLLERVLNARKRVLGPRHPNTLKCMNGLGLCYLSEGRLDEAVQILKASWDASVQELGFQDLMVFDTGVSLARLYNTLDQANMAEMIMTRIINSAEKMLGAENSRILSYKATLAESYSLLDRFAEAEKLAEYALETQKHVLGTEHRDTTVTMHRVARIWQRIGKQTEAVQMMADCLELQTKHLGPEDPYTLCSKEWLAFQRNQVIRSESLVHVGPELSSYNRSECGQGETEEDNVEELPKRRRMC